ncbi:MAG: aminoglycoside phosphotransferase (APT) family kinase protein [Planctomycetota bacterium]|jgi:aminoglycoside phosphotransferase (APT) family kinase protein
MSDVSKKSQADFGTPAPEWQIDEDLVRALLRSQHPDLADHEIVLVDEGWDNVMYRLGENLMIRMPRRELIVSSIVVEQDWLPTIAPSLSITVPAPVRIGHPESCYPWPWSIVPWIEGHTADQGYPGASEAIRFVQFLKELHQLSDAILPPGNSRGHSLVHRAGFVAERMARIQGTGMVTPTITRLWQEAMAAPLTQERRWIHGDLHGRNVLMKDGVIVGIIDWGDLFIGDVAIDLASIWMLFDDEEARSICLREYDVQGEHTITRALGWAVFYGVLLLDSGLVDNPAHAQMGLDILRRLNEDA